MSTIDVYEDLALLVVAFCLDRELDLDSYVEGVVFGGPLDEATVATLVRYHREWMR
jgi:hypothetical protein